MKRIKAIYLLASPLMFSFLCFVQLPGQSAISRTSLDNPVAFLAAYLAASIAVYLTFAAVPRFRKNDRLHIPSLVSVLPVVAGMGLSFLFDAAHFGIDLQIPIGGALIGVGSSLLFLSWGQAFSLLGKPSLVPTAAAMFAAAYLLKLAFAPFAETPFNLAIIGCSITVSALPLDWIRERQSDPAGPSAQSTPSASSNLGLRDVLHYLWRPLFGCVLCCMVWGFTWGDSLQGAMVPSTGNSSVFFSDLGKTGAALLIAAYGLKKRADLTQGLLLPLAAGCLLLGWMLNPLGGALGPLLIGFVSAFGFAAFEITLWVKTAELGAGKPAFCRLLFAATRTVQACTILLGIILAPLVGEPGAELFTPICIVIFFILYAASSSLPGGRMISREDAPSANRKARSGTLDADLPTPYEEYGLSPRESEVFLMFVKGHSAKYISETLVVSPHTVKTHIKRIYEKVGVHSKDELIARCADERSER
ncbi:MAG: helix-turn-helix transcriptional regulator [Gordonibacter sp.]